MAKNIFNLSPTSSNSAPGYLSQANAGMMMFPRSPGKTTLWDILGDITAGLAAASTANRGGLFAGLSAGIKNSNARNYYNQLNTAIQAEQQNQQNLANQYGGTLSQAGVNIPGSQSVDPTTGQTTYNFARGFDPDKIEYAAGLQQGNKTAENYAQQYSDGGLDPTADYKMVDPDSMKALGELFFQRQGQVSDSQNYLGSFQQGYDTYNQINPSSSPQPLMIPTAQNSTGALMPRLDTPETLNGGVQESYAPKYPQPNVWTPITSQELFKEGIQKSYDTKYQAPKLQAETKETMAKVPYWGAQTQAGKAEASKSNAMADAYKRGPGLGNYPPAGGGGASEMLELSRLTGQIDNDIANSVNMINNINNNLAKKDLKKEDRVRFSQEKEFYTRRLGTLFDQKQTLINSATQSRAAQPIISQPVTRPSGNANNPGAPIIPNTAEDFLRGKGIIK